MAMWSIWTSQVMALILRLLPLDSLRPRCCVKNQLHSNWLSTPTRRVSISTKERM